MPAVLGSVMSVFTRGIIERLADSLGRSPGRVEKDLRLIGPILVTALARLTEGPGGPKALAGLLDKLPSRAAGDPAAMLEKAVSGDLGGKMLGPLLGSRAREVTNSLARSSEASGLYDLLKTATPLALAQLAKTMTDQKLNVADLGKKLQDEAAALERSRDQHVRPVVAAFADADAQEAVKAKVRKKGWAALSSAPVLAAAYVVSTREPRFFGHPASTPREMKTLAGAFDLRFIPAESPLLNGVVSAIQESLAKAGNSSLPWDLGDTDLDDPARVRARVIDRLSLARETLAAMPADEQARYKKLIVDAATRVAEARREGGFAGLGGRKVSLAEQAAIDDIKRALYS